jgi:hypothetical protein
MILPDQHRLDTSRAELNAKNGLSALNCFLGIVSIHINSVILKSLGSGSAALWGCGVRSIGFIPYGFGKVERFSLILSMLRVANERQRFR